MLLRVGLVGFLGSVEVVLELRGRDIAEVAVETLGVVPVHPAQRGEFDVHGEKSARSSLANHEPLCSVCTQ